MAETDLIHDQSTTVPMQEFGGPSRGPCRFALPGAGAVRLPMYAAWAVTVASDESPCGSRVIASGPLPGADQCILRAEIYAGIVACAKFSAASIYSDNARFVKHANYFMFAKILVEVS